MEPSLTPMLARLARELPLGDYVSEPKWDGFRCLAFRDGAEVDLRSRHGRPLARYFPELVEAMLELPADRVVLDGEIVVHREGRFDFEALMLRLHPAASRVERLRTESPARFIAFDALAAHGEDLRDRPFGDRRRCLEEILRRVSSAVALTPLTRDAAVAARWLDGFEGGGAD